MTRKVKKIETFLFFPTVCPFLFRVDLILLSWVKFPHLAGTHSCENHNISYSYCDSYIWKNYSHDSTDRTKEMQMQIFKNLSEILKITLTHIVEIVRYRTFPSSHCS